MLLYNAWTCRTRPLQLRVMGSLDAATTVTDTSTIDEHDIHNCGHGRNHTDPLFFYLAAP